jgi:hypothetical protein
MPHHRLVSQTDHSVARFRVSQAPMKQIHVFHYYGKGRQLSRKKRL